MRSPPGAPSLERGLALLEALAGPHRHGARAAELQAALGIPRATLYRLLKALAERGLVFQEAGSGRYRLGAQMMELGFAARAASTLAQAAQPVLRRIARATHRMSELAVPAGRWQMMMLDTWLVEDTPLRVQARPGLFFELNHLVAHGLVYLAFDGERRLAEYRQRTAGRAGRREAGLARVPRAVLAEECERWRRLGYAFKRQGGTRHQNARVAVPVFDPHSRTGRLAGSLGLVCETRELTSLRAAQWAVELRTGARALEQTL